jgi:pimeloyl-ACP methyl ester carboxylesterase
MEFRVEVPGGELVGWETGDGAPALLLHGGPATDIMDTLVPVLPDTLRTIRYQQRGISPSTKAEPLDVDQHVADAVRVLDDRGVDRAWVFGHSWGGQLAFHLAVAHPERFLGLVAIDPLGAVPDGGWSELDAEIFARLERNRPEIAARAKAIDERAMAGEDVGEDEVLESVEAAWPYYFADPASAGPMPPTEINVALYAAVVASVHEHFERGTLERGLPSFEAPFTVIHGLQDPLPAEAGRKTAALVPHARFEAIDDCGHIPWLERPAEFRAAVDRALSAG